MQAPTLSTTLKLQTIVFMPPERSLAVRVTVCIPRSSQVKVSSGLVSMEPQLSVELPSPILAGKVPLPIRLSSTSCITSGHLAIGASVSLTVTLKEQPAELLSSSVAVTLTSVVPLGKLVPGF